jgi:hypothetical protein
MSFLSLIHRRRATSLAGACALVLGVIASVAVTGADSADAATCTAVVGTPCSVTGSADLSPGVLSATVPGSLTWAATLNGLGQQVVDTTAADQGYTVDDATGSGAGWHVTVAATTFTSLSPAATLPDTGTFSTTGSITTATATTAPTQACSGSSSDCTLPNNTATVYPVAVTTAAATPTPVTVYNATAGTGIGSVDIGGSAAAAPVGWWIHVPGTTVPATYTSTITVDVISGPT